MLNGPQGTTFGAGAMAGAIRYITNKPDLHAFSAGIDFDGGQIQAAQQNWTYEGFLNLPLIDGVLGLRVSAFSDSNGGFINNQLTTRTWVNGAVSNNAQWAGNDYNRENVEGGRVALKAQSQRGLERAAHLRLPAPAHATARGTRIRRSPPRTVERFGPESHLFETKIVDFHVDGDVGIGDLVFASTYWSPTAPVERVLAVRYRTSTAAPTTSVTGYPGTQEGFTCLNDPYYGGARLSTGCKAPTQFYEYHINPQRWSNELRLVVQGGRTVPLARRACTGRRPRDNNSSSTYYMPGLQY